MIIFLAALLDVPRQLYEAADLEGAGPWQRFRHVTLPMISPVIFFSVVIGMIHGLPVLHPGLRASPRPATRTTRLGYPQDSLLFYSSRLYQQGFEGFHMGYAVGHVLGACSWSSWPAPLVLIRSSRRWVHYQGGFR